MKTKARKLLEEINAQDPAPTTTNIPTNANALEDAADELHKVLQADPSAKKDKSWMDVAAKFSVKPAALMAKYSQKYGSKLPYYA